MQVLHYLKTTLFNEDPNILNKETFLSPLIQTERMFNGDRAMLCFFREGREKMILQITKSILFESVTRRKFIPVMIMSEELLSTV
jgi:hypothetical protein